LGQGIFFICYGLRTVELHQFVPDLYAARIFGGAEQLQDASGAVSRPEKGRG
jgi:hypothetical protein